MTKVGRPPKWETVEDLKKGLLSYFEYCKENKEIPNKAGLALHLGCHKDTLSEYVNNKEAEFSDAIKFAYSQIENEWIQKLADKNATGAIFYLKAAFGFRDRVDLTSDDKQLPAPLVTLDVLRNNSSTETSETTEEN